MLIKQEQEGNNIMSYFDSSNILASKYDHIQEKLAIIFKAGTQYVYEGVKLMDYIEFIKDQSQGRSFNSFIKKYNGVKTDKTIDPVPLKEHINNLKGL